MKKLYFLSLLIGYQSMTGMQHDATTQQLLSRMQSRCYTMSLRSMLTISASLVVAGVVYIGYRWFVDPVRKFGQLSLEDKYNIIISQLHGVVVSAVQENGVSFFHISTKNILSYLEHAHSEQDKALYQLYLALEKQIEPLYNALCRLYHTKSSSSLVSTEDKFATLNKLISILEPIAQNASKVLKDDLSRWLKTFALSAGVSENEIEKIHSLTPEQQCIAVWLARCDQSLNYGLLEEYCKHGQEIGKYNHLTAEEKNKICIDLFAQCVKKYIQAFYENNSSVLSHLSETDEVLKKFSSDYIANKPWLAQDATSFIREMRTDIGLMLMSISRATNEQGLLIGVVMNAISCIEKFFDACSTSAQARAQLEKEYIIHCARTWFQSDDSLKLFIDEYNTDNNMMGRKVSGKLTLQDFQ